MNKLERAASIVVTQCLKIKRTESVLVISDEPQRDIGHLLWTAALKATDNASLVEIKFSRSRVAEPPDAVAQFMSLVDVLIIATSRSLSHTPARRKACKKGTRVVCRRRCPEKCAVPGAHSMHREPVRSSDRQSR